MTARLLILLAGPFWVACSDHNIANKKSASVEEAPSDPPPFSNDWGQWLSMDVTADGNPVITFYDRDQGGIGFAMGTLTESGVSWAFEGVDGYPDASGLDAGNRGTYTSVTTTPDGTIWAAYYDQGAKNLRYAKRHPVLRAWTTGVADMGDGPSQDAGLFGSIALDADGNPIIAHYDKGKGTLRLARWNGINFVGSVFDRGEARTMDTGSDAEGAEADVGQFVKLQVIDGIEYMAYYDAANGNLKFSIGNEIHVVDSEGDVGTWPDFAVRSGIIHIMYQDKGNQQLKYAKGTPGSWDIKVVDDAPFTGADAALYFEGSDPRVVYFEGRSNDMKHAVLDGERWSTSVIATEGAVGFHNEVVSIAGKSYVACYNYTNRDVHFAALDGP